MATKALLALLGLVIVGVLAGDCITVSDFTYGNLNKQASSIHLTTFRAHFEKGAVHITDKLNFEAKPSICLRSLQFVPAIAGTPIAPVTLKTFSKRYNVETVSKANFASDAEGKIDLGEAHCDVSSFALSVAAGTETSLQSVTYCLADAEATRSNKKRSIELRDVDEEAVPTEGALPIVPTPFCTGKLGTEEGHEYCLGVFSYVNGNNFTITLDSNHTFFTPEDHAFLIAPENYYAGTQEAAVGVVWRCDKHIDTQIMFSLITPMTNTSTQAEERHDATIIRDFRKTCPEELMTEFADLDLSELINGDL